jgi:hypothetical protein
MPRLLSVLAALIIAVGAPAVLAADAVPVSVIVPYGDWVNSALPYAGYGLTALALYMVRMLPGQFAAIAHVMQAEALITTAISYGINATAGAAKDKTLTVNVANPVLAAALTYVLANAQPWVLSHLGDPKSIARMIWAKLDLPAESAAPDFDLIAGRAATIAQSKAA